MLERVQKFLSKAGIASRRRAEEMIISGRVKVNGEKVEKLGTKIDPEKDVVSVDGRVISSEEKKVYLMLNKPAGYVTTLYDPQGRRIVADLLEGVEERVYPVGRLDYDTKGLLLFTNDGDLTSALTHPRHEIPKTYRARVKGIPNGEKIQCLEKGIELEDGNTAPAKVRIVKEQKTKSELEITIHEGRNRQVRRMCEQIGHPVIELERVKVGNLTLKGLKRGEYRHLTNKEIVTLKNKLGFSNRE